MQMMNDRIWNTPGMTQEDVLVCKYIEYVLGKNKDMKDSYVYSSITFNTNERTKHILTEIIFTKFSPTSYKELIRPSISEFFNQLEPITPIHIHDPHGQINPPCEQATITADISEKTYNTLLLTALLMKDTIDV